MRRRDAGPDVDLDDRSLRIRRRRFDNRALQMFGSYFYDLTPEEQKQVIDRFKNKDKEKGPKDDKKNT
jgi:hypothetical protein